jgi:hypothetical protein
VAEVMRQAKVELQARDIKGKKLALAVEFAGVLKVVKLP